MQRKEVYHLAIDLIEEALEESNRIIVLEEKITRSICEPGIKEPTEQKLGMIRKDVMNSIIGLSESIYKEHSEYISESIDANEGVLYKNNSMITL